MLDIGWQELLVIGALALIVVGPKDLPGLLRSVGQWVGRLRGMARDFQRAMNDAAREADMANLAELHDLKKDLSGQLDFKAQAAKAQSFLNGPATPERKTAPASETAEAPKIEAEPAAEVAPESEPAEPAAPAAGDDQQVAAKAAEK